MKRHYALVLAICLGHHSPGEEAPIGPSVEGKWQACFTVSYYSKPACGILDVGKGRSLNPDVPGAAVFHRVTHTVPFGDLGYSLTDLPRYGVMATTADSSRWHLQLGFRDSTIDWAADDGSIVSDDIVMAGDSLVGTWARTSWGPSHHGSLVLQR